jgi:hypothetical protein
MFLFGLVKDFTSSKKPGVSAAKSCDVSKRPARGKFRQNLKIR